jgi:hypothetical protein
MTFINSGMAMMTSFNLIIAQLKARNEKKELSKEDKLKYNFYKNVFNRSAKK